MKRDRGYLREQRDRVVAKRHEQAQKVIAGRWGSYGLQDWERFYAHRGLGELENEQAWLGCRRARCGLCHMHKRFKGSERRRREQQALKDEALSLTSPSA